MSDQRAGCPHANAVEIARTCGLTQGSVTRLIRCLDCGAEKFIPRTNDERTVR